MSGWHLVGWRCGSPAKLNRFESERHGQIGRLRSEAGGEAPQAVANLTMSGWAPRRPPSRVLGGVDGRKTPRAAAEGFSLMEVVASLFGGEGFKVVARLSLAVAWPRRAHPQSPASDACASALDFEVCGLGCSTSSHQLRPWITMAEGPSSTPRTGYGAGTAGWRHHRRQRQVASKGTAPSKHRP